MENEYEFVDDYVIGYTKRNFQFYIDKEDYELVKQYYWKKGTGGMVSILPNGKYLLQHQLIMGEGIWCHNNGNIYDNRKYNISSAKGYKNQGKTILNGYIAIYMPEHPKAYKNGCVYEHILIAEQMLNRPLKMEECVHHKDLNKRNNDPNNLMVFATNSDHIAFHGGAEVVKLPDGTYKCQKIDELISNSSKKIFIKRDPIKHHPEKVLCPICNKNYKTFKAIMCLECINKAKGSRIPSKEELEQQIYTDSFLKIARHYNVSDNTIRKWCAKRGLPFRQKDIKVFIGE